MSLPDNDELREMLEHASAYPWKREHGLIRPARTDIPWSIAAIEDEDGQIGGDDDIDLMLIAPQLAEEVIRLRKEIDMMADSYRRKRDVVNERMAKHDPRTLNDFTLGKFFTLYTRVIDRLERIKEGGNE